MPRPVFPVVRLPYDQPDRVARVLDAVRRELRASRRQPPVQAACTARAGRPETDSADRLSGGGEAAMTARVQQPQHHVREPEKVTDAGSAAADAGTEAAVEQMTVGVRDCTLTPKARPEILVTTNHGDSDDRQRPVTSGAGGGAYLLVPPVNITAEISRPPLTPFQRQYTATS